MANAQDAIDKLDDWFASQDRQTIQDYIKIHDGSLNKSRIARDAGFGRKALTDSVNGNKRLQDRFEEIVNEIEINNWIGTKSHSANSSNFNENSEASVITIALERQLTQANQRIIKLEKSLAYANARISEKENESSKLSELREVMKELGFPI